MADHFDYHFLILPPELPGAWFTQAAREYWLKFQPIVTQDTELLSFIHPDATIAVTVLATEQAAERIKRQLRALRRDVHLDVIIAEDLPRLESRLNRRAAAEQRFGTEERA